MAQNRSAALERAIAAVAPGRLLRDGLDRILRAGMGALIVIGDGPSVLSVSSGGFDLDAALTPQRLSELAKMDGAVILSDDLSRIVRANVHLVPDPDTPTTETGTRHRTAERVARSLGVPVISVSERMTTITVYLGHEKYPLEPIQRLLARADQSLQALERYRHRHDAVMATLSALEVQDLVTVRDVASALQRSEMVVRMAQEVEDAVLELGTDGRMIRVQLVELMAGVVARGELVVRDYLAADGAVDAAGVDDAMAALGLLGTDELFELDSVAAILGLRGDATDLDASIEPRGYRMLSRIPHLPPGVIDALVDRYGTLRNLLRADVGDFAHLDGMDSQQARTVARSLRRLVKVGTGERYGAPDKDA